MNLTPQGRFVKVPYNTEIKKFEILTKKSGVGKTKQYFFPANYYNKVTNSLFL